MRSIKRRILFSAACAGIVAACGGTGEREAVEVRGTEPAVEQQAEAPRGEGETGTATVYAGMLEGRETAGGESFDHDELVAAHGTYPMGTRVRVTNLENDRTVEVRIADRIPEGTDAVIDLSRRAARELGIDEQGQARVRVEVID